MRLKLRPFGGVDSMGALTYARSTSEGVGA